MPTASAPAEFRTWNGDDLDAGFAQKGVGVDIAVIAEDNAGRDGQDVVAVIPLLAFRLEGITTGGDYPQGLFANGFGDDLDEGSGLGHDPDAVAVFGRIERKSPDIVDDGREDGDQITVAKGKDCIDACNCGPAASGRR